MKNHVVPGLGYSPYPMEYGDSYLNRMIKSGIDPERAVDEYADEDLNNIINLDRFDEIVIEKQKERDRNSEYEFVIFIESRFRDEQLFLTCYHPKSRGSPSPLPFSSSAKWALLGMRSSNCDGGCRLPRW